MDEGDDLGLRTPRRLLLGAGGENTYVHQVAEAGSENPP